MEAFYYFFDLFYLFFVPFHFNKHPHKVKDLPSSMFQFRFENMKSVTINLVYTLYKCKRMDLTYGRSIPLCMVWYERIL